VLNNRVKITTGGADNDLEDRPHFGPHISPTPRDQTDKRQHVSFKTNDMRDETDTQQPLASFF
jgi:hypothetical protein